jgi:hypothetical protein
MNPSRLFIPRPVATTLLMAAIMLRASRYGSGYDVVAMFGGQKTRPMTHSHKARFFDP